MPKKRRPPASPTPAPPRAALFVAAGVVALVGAYLSVGRQAVESSAEKPDAATAAAQQLWQLARAQQWSAALQLVSRSGAYAYRGLLTLTMSARAFGSLQGELSLSGICSGVCAASDGGDEAFERWLSWLAAQRPDGHLSEWPDALFAAVRARGAPRSARQSLSTTMAAAPSHHTAPSGSTSGCSWTHHRPASPRDPQPRLRARGARLACGGGGDRERAAAATSGDDPCRGACRDSAPIIFCTMSVSERAQPSRHPCAEPGRWPRSAGSYSRPTRRPRAASACWDGCESSATT